MPLRYLILLHVAFAVLLDARSVRRPKNNSWKHQAEITAIREGRFGDLGFLCNLLCETVEDYSDGDTEYDWFDYPFDGTYICSQLCTGNVVSGTICYCKHLQRNNINKVAKDDLQTTSSTTRTTTTIKKPTKPKSTSTTPPSKSKLKATTKSSITPLPTKGLTTTNKPTTATEPLTSSSPTTAAETTVPAHDTATVLTDAPAVADGAAAAAATTEAMPPAAEEASHMVNDEDVANSAKLPRISQTLLTPYLPEVIRLWCSWRDMFPSSTQSAALAANICPAATTSPPDTTYNYLPEFNL